MSFGEILNWHDVAVGASAVLCGLVAYIVNQFTKQLDDHEKDDNAKFDKLFDSQDTILAKISDGFLNVTNTIHDVHVQLIDRINTPHSRHDDPPRPY